MTLWIVATFIILFAAFAGWTLAAPFYFIGKFARQQIFGHTFYREREKQMVTFILSTSAVACLALPLGFIIEAPSEAVVIFSVAWGCTLGYTSLENFSDYATRLPKPPKDYS